MSDLNLLAMLDSFPWWSLNIAKTNDGRLYECTIRNGSSYYKAVEKLPADAIREALRKAQGRTEALPKPSYMKIAGDK